MQQNSCWSGVFSPNIFDSSVKFGRCACTLHQNQYQNLFAYTSEWNLSTQSDYSICRLIKNRNWAKTMQHPPHLMNTLGTTHIIQCAPHQPHHLNGMALRPPHITQLQLAPSQTPSQVVGSSKLHSGAKPFIPNSQLQKTNGLQPNQR